MGKRLEDGRVQTHGDRLVTEYVRVFYMAGLLALIAHYDECNRQLARTWAYLRSTWLVQHDTFEPLVATAAFAFWIWMWSLTDRFVPFMRRFLIYKGERPLRGHTEGVALQALVAYLVPLYVFDALYPRRQLPEECPTLFWFVLQLCTTIFLYDLFFFPVHFLFHYGPWRWLRALHWRHHTNTLMLSTEVLRHSFLDGACQVTVNIAVLNLVRAHPFVRAMHNIVVIGLLTECHAGYDAPWMLHRVIPFGWYGGAVNHEAHHYHGNRCFQQFFTWGRIFEKPSSPSKENLPLQ